MRKLRRKNGMCHSKIEGVNSASVNFMGQRMTIDANDENFDSIMKQVVKVCRKIEPDCTIVL